MSEDALCRTCHAIWVTEGQLPAVCEYCVPPRTRTGVGVGVDTRPARRGSGTTARVHENSDDTLDELEAKVRARDASVRVHGDPREKQATWTLFAGEAPPGVCAQCYRDHDPDQPHDHDSLKYQYIFYAEHNRWPTWADAMAHCSDEVRSLWRTALAKHGVELAPDVCDELGTQPSTEE